jgi:hypothetical protein
MSEENQSGISRCRPPAHLDPAARVDPPSPEEIKKATAEATAELEKLRGEYNRSHVLSFDPIIAGPSADEEELQREADALADEQMKLIEMLSQIPEENAEVSNDPPEPTGAKKTRVTRNEVESKIRTG